jgi:hypothetical protein
LGAGEVEIGGRDPRIGITNPPLAELASVCTQQSRAFLRAAALAPAVRVGKVLVSSLGDDTTRVEVHVDNHGYLPTSVLSSALELDFNEPLYVDCIANGPELLDPGQRHVVIGHLAGWGAGLHGRNSLLFLRASGNAHSARVVYAVRGTGQLVLRVGSCRVGFIESTVTLP